MRFCTRCGRTVDSCAAACLACGSPIARPSEARFDSSSKSVEASDNSTTVLTKKNNGRIDSTGIDVQPTGAVVGSDIRSRNPADNRQQKLVAFVIVLLLVISLVAGFGLMRGRGNEAAPVLVDSQSTAPVNGMVKVTIVVSGCDDCSINAIWSAPLAGSDRAPWKTGSTPVSGGVVSFLVPVGYSQGLAFEVISPRDVSGAIPIAVARYEQLAVGTPVSPGKAQLSKRAFGCWGGTTSGSEKLYLHVDWRAGLGAEGNRGEYAFPYFNPGISSFGDAGETWNGGLSHQNIWSCYNTLD